MMTMMSGIPAGHHGGARVAAVVFGVVRALPTEGLRIGVGGGACSHVWNGGASAEKGG